MALVVWAVFIRGDAERGSTSPGKSTGETSAVAEQIQELDARLARIEGLLGTTRDAAPAGTRGPSSSGPVHIPTEEEVKQQDARLQARLDALFAADARANDSAKWEARINQAFSDPNVAEAAQPSIRAAHCRVRVCRITAQFPPGADGSDWATRVSMALADGFSSSRLAWGDLPTGESGLTMYTFKKGTESVLAEHGL
ncbi:MAG: hypothetical protein ACMG5Z_04310 [Luteimonas sp.]